jgi:hypothetical protein
MISIGRPADYPIAADVSRRSPFETGMFVDFGHHMWAAMRAMSDRLERRFATFADVPYHDLFCRHDWEQLWETGLWDPPHRAYRLRRISRTPQPQPYSASRYESSSDTNVQLFRIPKF